VLSYKSPEEMLAAEYEPLDKEGREELLGRWEIELDIRQSQHPSEPGK